ncbi:MAG: hypothetical protein NVV73_07140 [Cellvibrionaceae bacterium]|nr:hypothetical protein [Cellvibrionaceae bacterium]
MELRRIGVIDKLIAIGVFGELSLNECDEFFPIKFLHPATHFEINRPGVFCHGSHENGMARFCLHVQLTLGNHYAGRGAGAQEGES